MNADQIADALEAERQRLLPLLLEAFDKFWMDLGFSAPEMHPFRCELFKERIADLLQPEDFE